MVVIGKASESAVAVRKLSHFPAAFTQRGSSGPLLDDAGPTKCTKVAYLHVAAALLPLAQLALVGEI